MLARVSRSALVPAVGTCASAVNALRLLDARRITLIHPPWFDHDWVAPRIPDDTDAVFIGGNGFNAAAAIDALERVSGRPVLESNQVLLWGILADTSLKLRISGYGRLFEFSTGVERGTA